MKRRPRSIKHYIHRLQPLWDVRAEYRVAGTRKRAYGIDLSRYEPRWHADEAEPGLIDFVFIKATQNVVWKDPAFEQLYVDIQPAAVTGAYHYLSSGYGGNDQAKHFLNVIDNKRFEVLICDFETYGNTVSDAFVKACYDWLVYVSSERPKQKVLLYTNPNLYDTVLFPAAMRLFGRDVFADWGLWIAQYPFTINLDGEPGMPKNRKDWLFWQFSDAGDPVVHGTDGWCDRNLFNGMLFDLLEWAGEDVVPEPPIGGDMAELFLGTIVTPALNVRSVPSSANNTPIGKLITGQRVMAAEKSNGWWKLLYVDHVKVTRESWAYEGANNGYIRQDDVIPMNDAAGLPELPWRFEIGDDQTYLLQVVNGVLKPK